MKYRFARPRLLSTLAMLCAVALFVRLGLWQYHKAAAKQALQDQQQRYAGAAATPMPRSIAQPEAWRYRRVQVSGVYDGAHQILLDNQIHQGQAGYHVLTPLRLDSGEAVLINRGWVAAPPDHRQVPAVAVPGGLQTLQGHVWLPGRYFTLEAAPAPGWQPVWQNLDLPRYAEAAALPLLPWVVRLDAGNAGDGLARDWPRPAERLEKHLAYAYQWFGFALTSVLIYLFLHIRRIRP